MPAESLTIHPSPKSWRQLLHHNTSSQATHLRRELNLPTDRPIIMAGHHPDFWHTGVLSKYLAADTASAALNAHPAWLYVDQDRPDSVTLRYPAIIGSATVRERSSLSIGTATVRDRKLPSIKDAHELVQPGLEQIRTAFAHHASAATLSHQLASTLSDLIQPYISQPHTDLFATTLSRTSLFQELVAQMAKDPERCISTYNAAAARHPTSGIRPLTASDIQDRWELPLWRLPPNQPRRHVYAEDLPTIPTHELAPKALFMTGLMRLAACDLFIHGLGAAETSSVHEGYEVITQEWFHAWLGVKLAPIALVTATRYLPLSDEPIPTAQDLARARWLAHHARHNPALLNNHTAAAAKQRILDQISLLPRHTRERSEAFRRLHAILETTRKAHAPSLHILDREAELTTARYAERELLFDRTWPFALFSDRALIALSSDIRAAFA